MMTQPSKPRVLIFSHRNLFRKGLGIEGHAGGKLFRCPHYEFEDVISQVDSVELLAPHADPSALRYGLVKKIAYHVPIALNPGIQKVQGRAHYDLFFAVCGSPTDLLMVNAAVNWKDFCTTSVCLIDELWAMEIDAYRHFVRLLDNFDVVMLYYSQSVKPVSERIGSKCVFLPPGVDALLFSAYPEPPRRAVDVYSIGRRSEITHQSLLRMAAEDGLFYLHDSIAGSQAIDSAQHRALFANIAKRSRYFIVNPGLIDRPDIRGNQIEIGNRYFEGAASGTIMVGERPNTVEFERLFDWPDALIDLAYNSSDIDLIINELDKQPERQERIRRTNTAQALLRHDWAYRWEAILKTAGLELMPQLLERKERLRNLAQAVLQEEVIRT